MRFAISKNSQPPSAMLAGQRMNGSMTVGIGRIPVLETKARAAARGGLKDLMMSVLAAVRLAERRRPKLPARRRCPRQLHT
jgi:hypothetical protein